ncbi:MULTISPECIES: hypothetical protein [Pseudoalteromonas]|jgi:TusA-related sulfurtransferase|uniref:Sulfurtransferase TusA family protein n=1 Tax=Pseudoalteromonas shioyasakiensis TaxID=1190813 RepID=A0ABT6U1W7_9GAMM|nr:MULTISPECIES: hypothetical protein [Pseudoalteromonas]MDC3191348.1 sulfurtransferase TusA family protein [Pseudoalteromonas elyakovii]KPM75276.1 hypothetical protein AOG26_17000 [Pseudoalteromonas sp. UCD-33C]KPV98543.1 hypothetical protein AN213_03602 [Pseudoalteromonas sp. P1-8]KPZ68695.1 hypothetical protein AN394_03072 [Pseudoalteromonas sp. P1-26]KTG18562.1 hypothetical protein AUR67_18555 [Pseudoalteromonas sp. XI10]|tara:strand:+ start:681 stop:899 length:219 start_codon:yes stop_codon:yes gene_type:complete
MLTVDLRGYKCPQQFIQFKLGLNKATSIKQPVTFTFNAAEATDDMQRFLEKHHYHFKIDLELGVLTVEPIRV